MSDLEDIRRTFRTAVEELRLDNRALHERIAVCEAQIRWHVRFLWQMIGTAAVLITALVIGWIRLAKG